MAVYTFNPSAPKLRGRTMGNSRSSSTAQQVHGSLSYKKPCLKFRVGGKAVLLKCSDGFVSKLRLFSCQAPTKKRRSWNYCSRQHCGKASKTCRVPCLEVHTFNPGREKQAGPIEFLTNPAYITRSGYQRLNGDGLFNNNKKVCREKKKPSCHKVTW